MSRRVTVTDSGNDLVDGATVTTVAAAMALGGLLAALDYYHPPGTPVIVAIAVGIAAIVFANRLGWRVGLVVLLIVTSFIDRHTFAVGRLAIRPEQVAALFALAFLSYDRVRKGDWWASLRPTRVELALLAWFAVGLVSSLALSPSRGQSLKVLALLLISSLALFIPRRLLEDDSKQMDQVVRWLLLAFAVESAYTVGAYFLRLAGPIVALSVNPAGGHLNAYGTLWEPNVLGAFSGAGAVAWVYLGGSYFRRPWIGIVLCLSALIVSFSRASWLAVALVLLLALVLSARRPIDFRSLGLATAVTLVIAAGVIAADRSGDYYVPVKAGATATVPPGPAGSGRLFGVLANLVDVLGRVYQFQTAFGDLKASPLHVLVGGGVDSYGERHTTAGQPQHIANLELAVVNDTGLLGLLVFVAFAVGVAAEVWRRRSDPRVTGLGAMVLVITITNAATETLELMITWLLLGVLLAATGSAPPVSAPGTVRKVRDTAS